MQQPGPPPSFFLIQTRDCMPLCCSTDLVRLSSVIRSHGLPKNLSEPLVFANIDFSTLYNLVAFANPGYRSLPTLDFSALSSLFEVSIMLDIPELSEACVLAFTRIHHLPVELFLVGIKSDTTFVGLVLQLGIDGFPGNHALQARFDRLEFQIWSVRYPSPQARLDHIYNHRQDLLGHPLRAARFLAMDPNPADKDELAKRLAVAYAISEQMSQDGAYDQQIQMALPQFHLSFLRHGCFLCYNKNDEEQVCQRCGIKPCRSCSRIEYCGRCDAVLCQECNPWNDSWCEDCGMHICAAHPAPLFCSKCWQHVCDLCEPESKCEKGGEHEWDLETMAFTKSIREHGVDRTVAALAMMAECLQQ